MSYRRIPSYPDDADYTTNAPSYYEDLARKQGLFKELAERIWGYEETMNLSLAEIAQRFIEWDAKIDGFDADVNELLKEWMLDGTFDHIINNTIFGWKANQSEMNERLRYIVNLISYPRLTNEANDDGRFNRAFSDLVDGGVLNLEHGASYDLYELKLINKNNIAINFNGAVINWYGKTTSNVWGEVGVLSFQGELVDGDLISYIRSLNTQIHQPPSNAPVLQSIEQALNNNVPYMRCSKVKTSNNNYFEVGDYIWLMGWTKENRFPYDSNTFDPEIRRVAKVINKDLTYLYVDYFTPWNMPILVDSVAERSRAMKVIPLKNIEINEPKIIDKTTLATLNSPTPQELNEAVSGICPILVDGLTINNFTLENPKYPALYNLYNLNYHLENITVSNAQMRGGGQGYAVQSIGCSKGRVKKVSGFKLRHVVDYSWSDSAETEDVNGNNCYESDIAVHGIGEHDLTFTRCKGVVTLGHGIEYFPLNMGKMQFFDCDIRLQVDINALVDSILCENSKVTYFNLPYSKHTKFNDCVVTAVMSFSPLSMKKRGLVFNSKMEIKGKELHLENTDLSGSRLTGFYGVDEIDMEDVEFIFNFSPLIYTTMFGFDLRQAKKIRLKNLVFEKMKFTLHQMNQDLQIDVVGCNAKYVTQNSADMLNLGQAVSENSKFLINVFNNTVQNEGASGNVKLAYLRTSFFTGCTIIMDIKDNKFLGTSSHAFHFINEMGSLSTIFDRNNLIKFNTAGSAFNITENLIINS